MQSVTSPAPAVKSKKARTIGWTCRVGVDSGLISIVEGDRAETYRIFPVECRDGRAFEMQKVDPELSEPYRVCLGDIEGPSCECKGFKYHGRCRHIQGLQAMQARGVL